MKKNLLSPESGEREADEKSSQREERERERERLKGAFNTQERSSC
jgi:hypothetical protein